jgi:DNA-binding NarL/FixJ family response regulator
MDEKVPNSLRVILIEDSPSLCDLLRGMLEELDGVEIVADAAGEHGALEGLERHHPDLVIVDLELREGSGLGVLSRLRSDPERFGKPRAVVFTNFAHRALREHCAALGVDRFFDKSFQIDELIDYVQDAVREP